MLVLARKLDEGIDIETKTGEIIRVTVVCIRRNIVKLGIEAADEFHIVRDNAVNKTPRERGDE